MWVVPRDWEAFQQLWYEARGQLSLSKATAARIASAVRQGALPSNAAELVRRVRALDALTLEAGLDVFNGRRLLAAQPVAVLQLLEGAALRDALAALRGLLPGRDATLTLAALLPQICVVGVQAAAARYAELDYAFRSAFGAVVPPAAYDYLVGSDNEGEGDVQYCITGLQDQLSGLQRIFGREAAYVALSRTPALLALPPGAAEQRLCQLQAALQLPDRTAALQAAEAHGGLLLQPPAVLQARAFRLPGLLGVSRARALDWLRRRPDALLLQSSALSERWAACSSLASLRPAWRRELASALPGMIDAVAFGPQERFLRLEYLLETNQGQGLRLRAVLVLREEDWLQRYPRFTRWLSEYQVDERDQQGIPAPDEYGLVDLGAL